MEKKVTKKTEKKVTEQKAAPSIKVAAVKKETVQKKAVSEIIAHANYVRMSARKIRLIADQIRKKDVSRVLAQLPFAGKNAALPIAKLIKSAVANAEHNYGFEQKDLFVKTITADEGPMIKRFRPRAYGRSTMIRKKTSLITLVLGVKEGAKQIIKKETPKKEEEVKVVNPNEVKKQIDGVGAPRNDNDEKGGKDSGFLKKVFSRKTG